MEKKLEKRGQVTIFVIIAILVVTAAILFFVLREPVVDEEFMEIPEIQSYTEECLKNASKKSILTLSEKGGYHSLPRYSTENAVINAPFYIYGDEIFIPSIRDMEIEMSKSIEENIDSCLERLDTFEDYRITSEEKPDISSSIRDSVIFIEMRYPITVENEGILRLENFKVEIPARLNLIYSVVENFVEEQKGEDRISISSLTIKGFQNDLDIHIVSDEEATFLNVFDYEKKINDKPLAFRFAIENVD